MAKLSTKALVVIALGLSFVFAFLIYGYLGNLATRATKDSVPVVVAKVDIPPKTRITAEMVQEARIPADYVQPGAITELSQVVGVVAREQIIATEQITQRRLLLEGKSVGFTGIIPPDKRAVTVGVSDVTGVAGFVKAGDYVDVVITFEQTVVGDHASKVVLQNLQVLAANRDTEAGVADSANKTALKSSTVTLAVTPDEAAQLTLGEEKGKIRLALRPYLPSDELVAVNAFTPKDLMGVHESPVQKRGGGSNGSAETAPAPASAPAAPASTANHDSGSGIQVIRGTKVSGQ